MCMKNFFKAIDSFLGTCLDYYDYRIRTGKYIADITSYLNLAKEFLFKNGKKISVAIIKSNIFFSFINLIKILGQSLIKISLLKAPVSFLRDTIKILIICYSEIFIVFALTFPTTILLLNWFETSIIVFLIGLIPILLIDIFCVSALYYCIDRQLAGDRVSIWKSFL